MATKTLYVGNLSYNTSEAALANAFAAFGGRNTRIMDSRGFGFVDVDADQADAAISAMNNKEFDGRTLNVNEARPREERSGGGGGGGNYRQGGRKRSW